MQQTLVKFARSNASICWAYAVQQREGGLSFGKIQQKYAAGEFNGKSEYWAGNSRRLYKNARGSVVRDKALVQRIDIGCPGTKRLLEHPFWQVMANPGMELADVHSLMKRLRPGIAARLIDHDKSTGAEVRKELKNTEQIVRIGMQNDLDALTALLLIIREFTLRGWRAPCEVAAIQANDLLVRLGTFEPFSRVAPAVYGVISEGFTDVLRQRHRDGSTHTMRAPRRYQMKEEQSLNKWLLNDALKLDLVGSETKEQLRLLFWVDWFEAKQQFSKVVRRAVESDKPFSTTDIPEDSLEVLNALNGDSRDYISKQGFYI